MPQESAQPAKGHVIDSHPQGGAQLGLGQEQVT